MMIMIGSNINGGATLIKVNAAQLTLALKPSLLWYLHDAAILDQDKR